MRNSAVNADASVAHCSLISGLLLSLCNYFIMNGGEHARVACVPASLRGKLKGRLCACVGGRERIQINSADYEIRKINL